MPEQTVKNPSKPLRPLQDGEIANDWHIKISKPREYATHEEGLLQITLFCDAVNAESCIDIVDFAKEHSLDEEILAFRSLRPKRLALHEIVAQVNVRVQFDDADNLREIVGGLYQEFINSYPSSLFAGHAVDAILQMDRGSDERFSAWVHYQSEFLPKLQSEVTKFLDDRIESGLLKSCTLTDSALGAVTAGGVASGKSSALTAIKDKFNGEGFQYISSDELIGIFQGALGADVLANYSKYLPKLCMAEVWHCKNRMYELLQAMDLTKRPHVVIEGMDPRVSLDILNRCAYQTTFVFVNTGEPSLAVLRSAQRAIKVSRHVPSAAASASYRDTWKAFYLCLAKCATQIHNDLPMKTEIYVTDSDLFYSGPISERDAGERMKLSSIICVNQLGIVINNPDRLLRFIGRSYMLHHSPNMPSDMWKMRVPSMFRSLLQVKMLFDLKIDVWMDNKLITENDLLDACRRVLAKNTMRRFVQNRIFARELPRLVKNIKSDSSFVEDKRNGAGGQGYSL